MGLNVFAASLLVLLSYLIGAHYHPLQRFSLLRLIILTPYPFSHSGLENQCSIYNLGDKLGATEEKAAVRISLPNKIVGQHSKYITNCAFCGSDQQLLTASADTTSALWDLERKDPIMKFLGHKMEVLG